jgi:hypothetical protein
MTFEIDPQVGAALAAMSDGEALPPPPPAGDVHARRLMLNAMLEYANNVSQPSPRPTERPSWRAGIASRGAAHVPPCSTSMAAVRRRSAPARIAA